MGEGHVDAVFEGVLRAGQGAPEPGRRRGAMAADLRQRSRDREERAGDVLRGVSERHGLEQQHSESRGVRSRADRSGGIHRRSASMRCRRGSTVPTIPKVLASISEVGFHSAVEFFATYAGRASDLRPYLAGAEINDDMNLRLQYLAGLGLNSMAFERVYLEMLTYRTVPEGLFTGSEGRMNALAALLRRSRRVVRRSPQADLGPAEAGHYVLSRRSICARQRCVWPESPCSWRD